MQTMDKDLKHSGITKEVGEERQDAVMGLILHKKNSGVPGIAAERKWYSKKTGGTSTKRLSGHLEGLSVNLTQSLVGSSFL